MWEKIIYIFERAGRIRAARELIRMGMHKEAKKILLGE